MKNRLVNGVANRLETADPGILIIADPNPFLGQPANLAVARNHRKAVPGQRVLDDPGFLSQANTEDKAERFVSHLSSELNHFNNPWLDRSDMIVKENF